MKLGLLGDVHARVRAPAGRQDDWFNAQLGKFRNALDWFKEQGCLFVLQPGDMFDSPRPANIVLSTYISELRQHSLILLAVLGQHDTYYHDVINVERTAPYILQSAGLTILLDGDKPFSFEDVRIWGASWGQEPPVMRKQQDGVKRILVTHDHVGDRLLWPGHKLVAPAWYVQQHPGFDFICLGDYHYSFDITCGSTRVVNMGCLMRMSNSTRDRQHCPVVGILDTETGQITRHPLPFEPAEVVFAPPIEGRAELSTPLQEFLDRLKKTGQLGTSFLDNLEAVIQAQEAKPNVRKIVDEILETVGVKDDR